MLIVVDPHSGVPVYRQIIDQVKFHVASGLLKPGDELPSTRALSSELGINPMTISKAYSFLERDGVVDRRPGRPLVVNELKNGEIRDKKEKQLRDSLQQTMTIVKQLGIEKQEALEIFKELLDDNAQTGESETRTNEPEDEE
jgi:GntR family transcriptional regulator